MKNGPTSIILMAVGIVLLNLAWSGRFKDVYQSLSGNGSTSQAADSTPTVAGTAGREASQPVIQQHYGNDAKQPGYVTPDGITGYLISNVKDCQRDTVMFSPDGALWCVDPSSVDKARGAGWTVEQQPEGGRGNISIVPLPNGFFGERYIPNARLGLGL